MQETLYQTADAEASIRQRMQETLYQTVDAEVSLSDSGCRRNSIRQRMQKSLYQTADAGVSLLDFYIRCLIERLLHPLSDIVSPASAV